MVHIVILILQLFQTVDKGQKDRKQDKTDASPLYPLSVAASGDSFDGLDPLSMFMVEQAASKTVPTSGPQRDLVGETFVHLCVRVKSAIKNVLRE